MSGKGSKPRPLSIDKETFDSNWDLIFKKDAEKQIIDEVSKLIAEATLNDTDVGDEKNVC